MLFFVEKRNLSVFFLFKNVMERRKQKNAHFLKTSIKLDLKLAGKYRSPCNFEKTQVPLGLPNRYKSYSAA